MTIYHDLEIKDILLKTRVGDDAAFAELVSRFSPMINKVISSFLCSSISYEEAFSEACVVLHRAALSYDLDQTEVAFGLYSRICIYRGLMDLSNRVKRHERHITNGMDLDTFARGDTIEARLVGRERMNEYLTKARSILSEYEYSVFLCYIEGDTAAIIAKKLGRTSKSVDNAKARILRTLREESNIFSDI